MARVGSAREHDAAPPVPTPGVDVAAWKGGFRRRRQTFRRFLKVRGAALGLGVVLLLVFLAAAAPLLAPHDPNYQDLLSVLQAPSGVHPFGTDDLGRDVLSRVIYGSRVSLQVGLISIGVALAGGITVGLLAGYFGGRIGGVLMRVVGGWKSTRLNSRHAHISD